MYLNSVVLGGLLMLRSVPISLGAQVCAHLACRLVRWPLTDRVSSAPLFILRLAAARGGLRNGVIPPQTRMQPAQRSD